jgi:hypothetical protein
LGNSTQYALERRLGRYQSQYGQGREKSLCYYCESNFGHPAHSLVTIPIQYTATHGSTLATKKYFPEEIADDVSEF